MLERLREAKEKLKALQEILEEEGRPKARVLELEFQI
jgi:hypothetical protein